MKLYVYVLEARDLPVKDSEALADAYVKLQVGNDKSRTRVVRKSLSPVWNEEFIFRVHELDDELVLTVLHHCDDDLALFNVSGDSLGRVRIPLRSVVAEDNQTLPPTWFSLEKTGTKGRFTTKDCGKILLTLSLNRRSNNTSSAHPLPAKCNTGDPKEWAGQTESSQDTFNSIVPSWKNLEGKQLMKTIASRLERLFNKNEETVTNESKNDDSSELSSITSDYEDCVEELSSSFSFEETVELMQANGDEKQMPDDLHGGILLDQTYLVSAKYLNKILFFPNSLFRRSLAELQGTLNLQEEPWTWKSGDMSYLTRDVTYTKAASKLVKAVKATEEQTYLKADGREFAVFVNVSTPDVPYGNCFKVELLYKIMPGPELSSGEESTHLVVSWVMNFYQSTVMRSMIEGAAQQGLKESFKQFADLLAQNVKPLDSKELLLDKENVLATLQNEHQSDWDLARKYFWNFTVVSTTFMCLYVLVHIFLSGKRELKGLEFNGLDLPDTLGEVITCGILVLQLERVYNMVSHFVQARLQRGNDHGLKAQGEGWVLTVALIEGNNLASLDLTGSEDPYVFFTCNGKTRTSSVKLQTCDPQWNEILEFDAMEEPPSVLDVEVFDFDGPFDQDTSLGHAEINFLKHTSAELADMWICLEGKLAQASQSKLHLRIFLDNDKGVDTIKEYLTKMEKEIGKKLNLRSPHRNSIFQKLFGLPTEEFLINDYSCYLKRKLPLQGRLFLSARIVGFYSNLFGYKTKLYFLWEDIEDVQVIPPSLASVGSPSLVIILRKGRGLDAGHGAKCLDEEGRLRFHFQSFVSFNVTSRTIMALWRTKALSIEQKAQIAEEQQDQDGRSVLIENSGAFLDVQDAKMSKVYSAEIPVNIKSLMEMFDGGNLEHKVMGKSGCLSYVTTMWETVKPGVFERHLCYKFNRHVSIFGGEVTSTQQKSPIANGKGWILDEVMTLHGVPFGDYFRVREVHFKYQIETSVLASNVCNCHVYVGIAWMKSTKFQQRITRNIIEKFTHRLKEIFELVEREILLANPQDNST